MNRKMHTPEGVRDIYGRECDKKRYLESRLDRLFRSYGYQFIETPTIEYFDVFGSEVGTTPSRELYKFFDREGETLVLRPDYTPAIARAVAMYFAGEELPLRLCYRGNVFVNKDSLQGRLRESTQMGVELVGEDSAEADAEIIALLVSSMRAVGIPNFRVSIGNAEYYRALAKDSFLGMPELYGDRQSLAEARKKTKDPTALAAIERLEEIREILDTYGCADSVTFDLGTAPEFGYYTGVVFQVYSYGSGDALIKGGRYDKLLSRFGKDAPAIGFVARTDALLSALERQDIEIPVRDRKTMVLYPEDLSRQAVLLAEEERKRGLDIACVRFLPEKVLEDYKAYGRRNQFGGIVYFRSEDEAYAIDLQSDEAERIDLSRFFYEGEEAEE